MASTTTDHRVVSRDEWRSAREAFLAKEKELSRLRDDLNRQRRELPWEKVEKTYVFDGPDGRQTLAELFGKHSQLVVYHFMFAPDWDEGCPHCSFWADNFDGSPVHLAQRDVSFVVISRAPLAKLQAFRKRMGWSFKWVSSGQTDFNYNLGASFTPEQVKAGSAYFNFKMQHPGGEDREGMSAFYKDDSGAVYHTYSTFERGIDLVCSTYNILDMAPKGRDENPEDVQDWVRYHDKYEN